MQDDTEELIGTVVFGHNVVKDIFRITTLYVAENYDKYKIAFGSNDLGNVVYLVFNNEAVPIPNIDLDIALKQSRAIPEQSRVIPRQYEEFWGFKRIGVSSDQRSFYANNSPHLTPKENLPYKTDVLKRNKPFYPHIPSPPMRGDIHISKIGFSDGCFLYGSRFYQDLRTRVTYYSKTLVRAKLCRYENMELLSTTYLAFEPGQWVRITIDDRELINEITPVLFPDYTV